MTQPDSFGVQRTSAEGSISPAAWAAQCDDSLDALLTLHSGEAAPSYIQAGMKWLDTSSAPWVLYFYDGNAHIPLKKINATTHKVQHSFFKGTNIASAAALSIPGDGNVFEVTGTTDITSIATLRVGSLIALRFAGQLMLTHGTNLRLPDAANISTRAGDYGLFHEIDNGKWECVSFSHNTSKPIPAAVAFVLDALGDLAGKDTVGSDDIDNDAVGADQLDDTGVTAGSYKSANVTVDAQGRVTSIEDGTKVKAWLSYQKDTNTILGSENVASVTDNGTGAITVNFTTAMANTNYAVVGAIGGFNNSDIRAFHIPSNGMTTSSFKVYIFSAASNNAINTARIMLAVISV